jgi:arylsulfatase
MKKLRLFRAAALQLALAALAGSGHLAVAAGDTRPNFLIIVADDLGFSDLGAFGGEIETPSLDRLAESGLRLTDFHTAATCSPTRVMLMTGVDHHRAGIANMEELMVPAQRGRPGYLGHIGPNVVTLSELLRDAGYFTVMSGKWHLGLAPEQNPAQRGFEQSFALLPGGENHFARPSQFPESMAAALYSENGKPVPIDALPEDFYSSDYFADKLVAQLRAQRGDATGKRRPFFAYLPFTAPHWPLQAPAATIEKYRGRYDRGWEVLRQERLQRQQRLGLLAADAELTPPATLADWEGLSAEQKRRQARMMEVYAAMVDRMDYNIGRVVDYLREQGELDNTVIVFFSDNGAEGGSAARQISMVTGGQLERAPYESLGGRDSRVSYGAHWAQAATAPYRLYKSNATEGGLRTPAIIRYPGFARQGIGRSFLTVMDIAPTVLQLAGVEAPGKHYRGRSIEPMSGRSLVPWLDNKADGIHAASHATGWELFGQRALRQGDWKITYASSPNGSGHWELYDLAKDPGERYDLSARHPARLKSMVAEWDRYAAANDIILHEQVISPYTTPID